MPTKWPHKTWACGPFATGRIWKRGPLQSGFCHALPRWNTSFHLGYRAGFTTGGDRAVALATLRASLEAPCAGHPGWLAPCPGNEGPWDTSDIGDGPCQDGLGSWMERLVKHIMDPQLTNMTYRASWKHYPIIFRWLFFEYSMVQLQYGWHWLHHMVGRFEKKGSQEHR